MSTPDAAPAGQFTIGGDLTVNRLGFGAMRITGNGIWGPPADIEECRRVLRRLRDLNVDFIDTADSYGPEVSENLLAEELAPYTGLVIATKGGHTRPGPNQWVPNGRPEYLKEALQGSLRRLRVERIDLWQLHRIDPKVPRNEQFGAIAELQNQGLIRHVGLSEVTVEEIEAAEKYFPVATVQNRYNVNARGSESVLDYCEKKQIGFIPWAPLGSGTLARDGSPLAETAARHNATPSQVALAWMLKRSPVIMPIPGTSKVSHLEENVAAAAIQLSDAEFKALGAAT
jgi:aryl-alcohol dehydrogenase-like predicted oxidoreductase